MKRTTHLMIGAAVAMPVAATLAPAAAAGAVWWGMVGGGFPDWLDLRSEFRRGLRHRGASHSIAMGIAITAAFWFALAQVSAQFPSLSITASTHAAWSITFSFGFFSHILADACTHAGVRPLLPFSRRRFWLLPGFLRGKSSGYVDGLARTIASFVVVSGIIGYLGVALG